MSFNVTVPISCSSQHNSNVSDLLKMIPQNETQRIVLTQDKLLGGDTYEKGAILNLQDFHRPYLSTIAEQVDGILIYTQSEENTNEQTDEHKTHPNMMQDLYRAILVLDSQSRYPMSEEDKNNLLDFSKYLTKVRVNSSTGEASIEGYIRDIKEDSDMSEAYRIGYKPFEKGNATYYLQLNVSLNFDNNETRIQSPRLTAQMYLRQNMIYFKEELAPIIKAARAYAHENKIMLKDPKADTVERIISNEIPLEFQGYYGYQYQNIDELIDKFTTVVNPIARGIQKAVEEAPKRAKLRSSQIAVEYFQ